MLTASAFISFYFTFFLKYQVFYPQRPGKLCFKGRGIIDSISAAIACEGFCERRFARGDYRTGQTLRGSCCGCFALEVIMLELHIQLLTWI